MPDGRGVVFDEQPVGEDDIAAVRAIEELLQLAPALEAGGIDAVANAIR